MKKLSLLLLTLTVCFFTACHKDIWAELENLDQRVTKLEELCKEMNTNITSLQTIVSVLQSNDFITGIVEIKKNGEVIGYTITFGKHDPITIYHGQDGKDGADGKDGQDGQNGSANAPVIGVAQDTDGVYYWTLNGEWLLDDNGNKLPVSGKDGQNGTNGTMPQLKIEEGYWYVSYDNGVTWTQLGKATGEDGEKGDKGDAGDSMFQSVTQDENYVYFTLADGTVIKIAKGEGVNNNQPNSEFIFIITYDANGGEGIMMPDTFYYGVAKKIQANAFTINSNKIYVEWNTKPDGTGIAYQENQEVIIAKNIKLYAIWETIYANKFSVSDTKQVYFSMGNLQYQASTNSWRFAENQYDYIGENNTYISTYYTGWIDLFGWGTGNNPTLNIKDSDYYMTFTDWGCNQIGEYPAYTWRTLTYAEWNYLIAKRTNASKLYCLAKVGETNGLIILPDCWITPHGFSLTTGSKISYEEQCFTLEQWEILESAGAIFLPAAGLRIGVSSTTVNTDISSKNIEGCYWSASKTGIMGYQLRFKNKTVAVDASDPYSSVMDGKSVRLVKNVE